MSKYNKFEINLNVFLKIILLHKLRIFIIILISVLVGLIYNHIKRDEITIFLDLKKNNIINPIYIKLNYIIQSLPVRQQAYNKDIEIILFQKFNNYLIEKEKLMNIFEDTLSKNGLTKLSKQNKKKFIHSLKFVENENNNFSLSVIYHKDEEGKKILNDMFLNMIENIKLAMIEELEISVKKYEILSNYKKQIQSDESGFENYAYIDKDIYKSSVSDLINILINDDLNNFFPLKKNKKIYTKKNNNLNYYFFISFLIGIILSIVYLVIVNEKFIATYKKSNKKKN